MPAAPHPNRRQAALLLAGLWGAPGRAQAPATVELVLDLREAIAQGRMDPQRDRVGVRGAAPLGWGRSQLADADPATPGLYRTRLAWASAPNQPWPHKFKIERPGEPQAGWEDGPNRVLTVQPGAQVVQRAFGSAPVPPAPRRTGHIDRLPPQASAFVSPREVQVWLPPGYAPDDTRRLPVLYLHDGQNLFDAQAAGAEWQVDESAQSLVLAGEVQPFIVVAVSSNADRILDYTPTPGRIGGQTVGGGAARYARYLVDELKPLIDRRYRTRPGRADTAVGGSSLGGLVSAWLLMAEPGVFGAALVVSPSVWWNDAALLQAVVPAPSPAPRVWLDVGLREPGDTVALARRLRDRLLAAGYPVHHEEAAEGAHDEISWAARVAPMLRFLYGSAAR